MTKLENFNVCSVRVFFKINKLVNKKHQYYTTPRRSHNSEYKNLNFMKEFFFNTQQYTSKTYFLLFSGTKNLSASRWYLWPMKKCKLPSWWLSSLCIHSGTICWHVLNRIGKMMWWDDLITKKRLELRKPPGFKWTLEYRVCDNSMYLCMTKTRARLRNSRVPSSHSSSDQTTCYEGKLSFLGKVIASLAPCVFIEVYDSP